MPGIYKFHPWKAKLGLTLCTPLEDIFKLKRYRKREKQKGDQRLTRISSDYISKTRGRLDPVSSGIPGRRGGCQKGPARENSNKHRAAPGDSSRHAAGPVLQKGGQGLADAPPVF